MNLKIWLKGAGIAILSAFITALTTMTVSPTTFNFTKSGLEHLVLVAIPIAAKAVALYLQKSPLVAQ